MEFLLTSCSVNAAGSGPHLVGSCMPLDCMTPEELARIDNVFKSALRDATHLVFWTGIPHDQAQCWAKQHGLKTLTIAMGTLYNSRQVDGARYGKSTEEWSKYMKGASGRFAEYACRGGRQAVVLTNPPPDVYSRREHSSYREVEEPILKGTAGRPGTARIEYVHPTIQGAAEFRYQIWPHNASTAWNVFLIALSRGSTSKAKTGPNVVGKKQTCKDVVQKIKTAVSQKAPAKLKKMKKKRDLVCKSANDQRKGKQKQADVRLRQAQEKKKAKEERAKLERQRAEEKQKAQKEKAELEQRRAEEKKQKKAEQAKLELETAQARKRAQKEKARLEQQKVIEKNNAKQQKEERKRANIEQANLEQLRARERKQAARENNKLEEQRARERKQATKESSKLEEQRAREMKQATKEKHKLEQQRAREMKQATKDKNKLEQRKAQERKNANRKKDKLLQQRAKKRKEEAEKKGKEEAATVSSEKGGRQDSTE